MSLLHVPTRALLASAVVSSVFLALSSPAHAQSVVSAEDTFNTQVSTESNIYNITGGQISESGDNLFHSLEQLNLDAEETANFLTDSQVQNVLGRITGNEASNINGRLQITGSEANLFLLNPAGFLFGPDAALNLPASFTATTASGIGFDSGWFDLAAMTAADFSGTPITFGFTENSTSTIANAGSLGVSEGQNLSLIANRVVNNGALSAPGGNITVAAIAGKSNVNISTAGQILSVEVPNSITSLAELPELLTGETPASANSFRQNADGSIELTATVTVPEEAGIAAVSGTLTTAGDSGGNIQVFGEKVALVDAALDASGTNAGGSILAGGDYQGSGPLRAQQTFVDADSSLNTSASASGDAGTAIVWADGLTEFYGTATAQGGAAAGDGGFVEVSGAENLVYKGTVDTSAANGSFGTLLLDPKNIAIIGDGSPADGDDAGEQANALGSNPFAPSYTLSAGAPPRNGTFQIYESELEGMSGATNIALRATDNITINDLPDDELRFQPGTGSITFTADANNDDIGSFIMNGTTDVIRAAGRDVKITGFGATISSIDTSSTGVGGDISVLASGGDIKVAGGLTTDAEGAGLAGNIRLRVTEQLGSIIANSSGVTLSTASQTGNGGDITLRTAGGSIRTLDVTTESSGAGTAGNVNLVVNKNSQGIGQIDTSSGTITASSANGTGGNVRLITAEGNIDTADINTSGGSTIGNAGNITARVQEGQGAIDATNGRLQATATNGEGGRITLNTNRGNIGLGDVSVDAQNGNAGNISATVDSQTGSIDSTVGALSATSQSGNGGNIRLTTQSGGISASNISTTANASGQESGRILLTVDDSIGSIDTTTGTLTAGNGDGNGGRIKLETQDGNVSAGNLNSSNTASGSGGNIDITVNNGTGSIDLSSATVTTSSDSGNAGNVKFETARGSIQSRGIDASSGGNGRGGRITYTTEPEGSIDTTNGSGQTLDASSVGGRGGRVELSSGVTNVTSINANGTRGGNIRFFSDETNIADGSLVQANNGRVQFASLKPGLKVRVGGNADTGASILDITQEDLNRLSGNFRYIVIGDESNNGVITVVPGTQFPTRVRYEQRRSQ